jgi:hypothetical protein
MQTSGLILIVVIVIIVMLIAWGLVYRKSRQVNLTKTPAGQKPEWMRTAPPAETTAATEADGEGIALYDYDKGESLAAPFAEQVEDILRSRISKDPYLQSYEIDFGTAPDGRLIIIIGDKPYTDIKQIPDERLRAAIQQAVATYNQRSAK